jgi:hypothetical protein
MIFSTKLFFPRQQISTVNSKLSQFKIGFDGKPVDTVGNPPPAALNRVSPYKDLLCYQLLADPPLVEELIRCMERKVPENTLESFCVNLHAEGVKFGCRCLRQILLVNGGSS